jgi:hypothetical protein
MASYSIPIPVSEVTEAPELPSLTYALDLDAGRILGKIDGLAAVNQAIRKALITPRFKCLIYDNQYGSEIKEAVTAKDATREYAEAVIPRFVEDALRPDTRVLKIYDFSIDFQHDAARISFKADTIYGETAFEEVI